MIVRIEPFECGGMRVPIRWLEDDLQAAGWDESKRKRGKTTPESRGGSFAPRQGPREFESIRDSDKWLNQMRDEAQPDVIWAYTQDMYEDVNNALRTGNFSSEPGSGLSSLESEELQDIVSKMDAVIESKVTPEDVVVWRGVENVEDFKVGAIARDKAYVSTSLSRRAAEEFAGGDYGSYLIKISVPKGTNAYPGAVGIEQELILGRGSGFRITKVGKTKSKAMSADGETIGYVEAEYIAPESPELTAAAWDESKYVRGKTTPESRGGSFKPKDILDKEGTQQLFLTLPAWEACPDDLRQAVELHLKH